MKRVLILAVIMLATAGRGAFAAERPNIIVIFTDDHGHADMSCEGVLDDIKTPHIDWLAAGGVRMASGYVTAPQCVPSRAGLLTGISQNRFGVESNGANLDGFNAELTIAERLKKAGYATGMIGKWHLGPIREIGTHGFDDVFAKNSNRPGWANYALDGTDRGPGAEKTGLYHLDACSQAARAFIQRHHDRSFFLYLAYRAPHVPLDAPERYLKRFPGEMPERRRQALAMLSSIDDGVGGILKSLRQYSLEERTLIFFIGDNGAPLKIHKLDAPGGGPGWDGSLNDPLNGEKGMLTEGGIRVPFVVCWKGTLPARRVYQHPVTSLDVASTALAAAGLPADNRLDGVNLVPFLSGKQAGAPHEFLCWRWVAQSAIREGRWKLLRGGDREYLYDLNADREEKHNALAANPEIAQRLRTKLRAWAAEMQPPGLAIRPMAATWDDYFDFYLEGKPPPARTSPSDTPPTTGSLQGWIARNGSAVLKNDALRVEPSRTGAKQLRPFIARASIELPAPLTAKTRLRCVSGGKAGFAWRMGGQRSFPADQAVAFDLAASADWQDYEVKVPVTGKVIHIRVLFPARAVDVGRIEFCDEAGRSIRRWQFPGRVAPQDDTKRK